MDQILNYTILASIGALIVDAVVLQFKTVKIERILLNDREKLLLDLVRITVIGFIVSTILYNYLIESNMKNGYSYIAAFIVGWLLSVEIYYIVISSIQDIGFGRNFYIIDNEHGKLYIIKNSTNKYILFADRPRIMDSTFSIFKDESYIEGKKVYTESKKVKDIFIKKDKPSRHIIP